MFLSIIEVSPRIPYRPIVTTSETTTMPTINLNENPIDQTTGTTIEHLNQMITESSSSSSSTMIMREETHLTNQDDSSSTVSSSSSSSVINILETTMPLSSPKDEQIISTMTVTDYMTTSQNQPTEEIESDSDFDQY